MIQNFDGRMQSPTSFSFRIQAPVSAESLFQQGLTHHQQGQFAQAQAYYDRALKIQANHFDTVHLSGVLAAQTQQHQLAVDLISKAIAINPHHADAYNNLGNAQQETGELQHAIDSYTKAIELNPGFAEAYNNRGALFLSFKQFDSAIESFCKAIEMDPALAEAYVNRGNALQALGRHQDAVSDFNHAVLINPQYTDAMVRRGDAYFELSEFQAALNDYEAAITLNSGDATTFYSRGVVLRKLNRDDEALASFDRAIQLTPDYALAHNNRASVLLDFGRLNEAIVGYRSSIRFDPVAPETHNNLGNAYKNTGQFSEAIASFKRAIEIKPDFYLAFSNLLLTMQYAIQCSAEDIYAEHHRYAQQVQSTLPSLPTRHHNSRESGRLLRLGYVSGDFRNHAVAFFIEPILASHDRSQFEIHCYYNHTTHDAHTAKIASFADQWCFCNAMSDEQLANRIIEDGIDILVDLSGHTAHNRLPMFARKPAPVQITWIGYAGTTGLAAMDYRITDAYMDPPGLTERYHSETLLRLPHTNTLYQPEPGCPEVNELPALASNGFVFASLNNLTKINQSVVDLWAKILMAVPQAKLMLANVTDPTIEERVVSMFALAKITPNRLMLKPRMPTLEYLALHHQIDVALDPFPYNGGTTSIHSLWMGIPVITLGGEHTISRVGTSILSQLGLHNLIAKSEEEYLKIAITLTKDLQSINSLRQSLRGRMQAAAGERIDITRALEVVYREVWEKWCDQ